MQAATGAKRVLFITFGRETTASTRLRVLAIIPHLSANGIVCDVLPWNRGRAGEIAAAAGASDLVYVQKAPVPTSILSRAKAKKIPIVYDFDDAVWTSIRPRLWPASARVRGRFGRLVSTADVVVAANSYLADEARRSSSNVVIVPTPVDISAYAPRSHSGRGRVVGWVGSVENLRYVRQIEPALAAVAKAHRDVVLRIVCNEPFHSDCIKTEFVQWELGRSHEYASGFDIGLSPGDGSVWSLGKSSYKAIESMASAVPVVASRVGYNLQLIRDGVDGFLADGAAEWADRIGALVEQPELREKIGSAGRARVSETHALPLVAAMVHKLISDLLS